MTSLEMECALISYFSPTRNIIVPNVSWGMGLHECDLLVVTPTGCSYEIEIKIDKYDLKKDKLKYHEHRSIKITRLYFALPSNLLPYVEHVPERAGIIEVAEGGFCNIIREAESKNTYRFTEEERTKLMRLGCLRILPLKRKVKDLIALQKGIVNGNQG
jgi:hypothetical protein